MALKHTILLDADVPVYRFSAKGERTFDWGDGNDAEVVAPPLEYAVDNMLQHINDLKERLDADRVVLCLTDKDRSANWRYDHLPTYKGERKDKERPKIWNEIEAALVDHFQAYRKPRLEGDDVLGILATHPTIIKGLKTIVTIDKDMKTIPSRKQRSSDNQLLHLPAPSKGGNGKVVRISEEDADWYWMYQTLIGDTTDGYKGCPLIGDKRARAILGEPQDGCIEWWWTEVVETFKSKKLTEADALVQARVARIARAEDYDYRRKVIKPWEPGRKPYEL